jgi:hypothetical protein
MLDTISTLAVGTKEYENIVWLADKLSSELHELAQFMEEKRKKEMLELLDGLWQIEKDAICSSKSRQKVHMQLMEDLNNFRQQKKKEIEG